MEGFGGVFIIMTTKVGEDIKLIFSKLYNQYGPQGWWPLINYEGSNTTKTGATKGYHPLNYESTQNKR